MLTYRCGRSNLGLNMPMWKVNGMAQVFPERYTADTGDDEITVFLIGMRFHRWWRVDTWWPVFVAMPRILRYLAADPGSGLLGWHMWPGERSSSCSTGAVPRSWWTSRPTGRTARRGVVGVQPAGRWRRLGGDLARDLRRPGRPCRDDLRQHAALRAGGRHRPRAGRRGPGQRMEAARARRGGSRAPAPVGQDAGASARGHGLGAAVRAWAVVSGVNLAIWALVSLTATSWVYPWWIWVAGPWGAVPLVSWIAGRGPSSGRGPVST